MDTGRTYTISEVAALTGLHKNTVRQRIRLGQLSAVILPGKFGDEYRVAHEALVAGGLLDRSPSTPGGTAEAPPAQAPSAEAPPAAASEVVVEEPLPTAAAAAAESDGASAALRDLYARHEQAMFRLGYLQGELERAKALAETAESLRRDHEQQRSEAEALRRALAEQEQRDDATRAELERLRESLAGLKTLAAEQQAVIESLAAAPRRRWFWRR